MKKIVKVGLFGISLESVNYGVTALTYTQLVLLQKIAEESHVVLEFVVFADDTKQGVERVKKELGIKNITIKYIVRIKTGIPGYIKLKKDIKACDFIIDLTYGDSFSDIYGRKAFYLYSLPKLIAIWSRKVLVLGPQTIGPFFSWDVRWLAKYILKHSTYIFSRDIESVKYVESISGRKDVIRTSDLAMDLPFQKDSMCFSKEKLHVGLNVSQLLWNNDQGNSKFNMRLSYRELIGMLLEECSRREITVHLITHVYDKTEYNEYNLSEDLHKTYENTVIAPAFSDPIDAKNYISCMDVFIGSRMHATIAAFSSGVPVIPISYSRKFEGLYGSIGYKHCIDCSDSNVASVVNNILGKLRDINTLCEDRAIAYEEIKKLNKRYYDVLKKVVCSF